MFIRNLLAAIALLALAVQPAFAWRPGVHDAGSFTPGFGDRGYGYPPYERPHFGPARNRSHHHGGGHHAQGGGTQMRGHSESRYEYSNSESHFSGGYKECFAGDYARGTVTRAWRQPLGTECARPN